MQDILGTALLLVDADKTMFASILTPPTLANNAWSVNNLRTSPQPTIECHIQLLAEKCRAYMSASRSDPAAAYRRSSLPATMIHNAQLWGAELSYTAE